jgi:hypothetical protein
MTVISRFVAVLAATCESIGLIGTHLLTSAVIDLALVDQWSVVPNVTASDKKEDADKKQQCPSEHRFLPK